MDMDITASYGNAGNVCIWAGTCHVVVGTPGRICALLDGRGLHAKHMRLLVLDEADQLMTESFQEDVLWAHSVLPSHKQVNAIPRYPLPPPKSDPHRY